MHHKRVVQEKTKLISDIKRLKKHYEHYEPTLKQLQHKYEVVMKEKMLIKLERDRLAAKVSSLFILNDWKWLKGGKFGAGEKESWKIHHGKYM